MASARIRLIAAILTASAASLPIATQTLAQEHSRLREMTQTDWKTLTDERIAIVKAALQLTPEQAKLWPPVEAAIRARAETRQSRFKDIAERLSDEYKADPVEMMRGRAEALDKRAENLKNLADAWEPLAQTLNPDQKRRMKLLVFDVIRDMRDVAEDRRMETFGMGR